MMDRQGWVAGDRQTGKSNNIHIKNNNHYGNYTQIQNNDSMRGMSRSSNAFA